MKLKLIKILFYAMQILWLIAVLFSCSPRMKEGCNYGQPHKSHKALPKGFLVILVLLMSQMVAAQPKNIQARAIEVLYKERLMALVKVVTMNGRDTGYIRYAGTGKQVKSVVVGTWFTIRGCACDPREKWITRKITINR